MCVTMFYLVDKYSVHFYYVGYEAFLYAYAESIRASISALYDRLYYLIYLRSAFDKTPQPLYYTLAYSTVPGTIFSICLF